MTMTRAGRRPYETIQPATIGHLRLLRVRGVGIDLDGRRVFTGNTEIRLAPKEFELLRVLLENAGRILSRRELLDTVWCPGYLDANKTLETHIRRLRRKLGSQPAAPLIRTVRGSGYIFDVDAGQLTGPG
jgi:two-component system response regulator RegX3